MVSMRALMVEYLPGSPLAKNGTIPHRTRKPCRSPLRVRTMGTGWVGATLKLAGNCHSVRTRLNSRSIEASSGDTYLPHMARG